MPRPSVLEWDVLDLAARVLERYPEPPLLEDFGPYRILKSLGRGGMGEVFLAENRETRREVALKIIRSDQAGTDLRPSFAREIQTLAKLEHANIARLYEVGVHPDGTPFFAMEYVEGKRLDHYSQETRLSLVQVLSLFRSVCEAVRYAHSRAVIHLDLKPSNILVKSGGEPVLLDFGVAQRLRAGSSANDQGAAATFGLTPGYAAPEQFGNESPGFQSDIHALGVILCELLTGRFPFDIAEHTATNSGDLASGSCMQPRAPSVIAQRQTAGAGRALIMSEWRDLDALCLKATSPDAEERYQSVESLIRELDRFSQCHPLEARAPHALTYKWGKFLKRNRRSILAVSLIGVLLSLGVGTYTYQLAKARNAALAEMARTEKVMQFFVDTFNHAAEDAPATEKAKIINLLRERGVRDASFLKDAVLQADIYLRFGQIYEKWGSLDRAEGLIRDALATDQKRLPHNDPHVIKAKLALGHLLNNRGHYDDAISIGNEVLQRPPAKGDYTSALKLIADGQLYLGHLTIADTFYQKVLAADTQLYGQGHPELAEDLMNLGNCRLTAGNYAKAENFFREAFASNQAWYGVESPEAADSASYVAQALYFQGGHEKEEVQLLAHALAALKKTRGEQDIRVAFTLAQMGAVAIELKNLDEAAADFKRSAEIYRAIRGDDHQTVAIELANVASIYLEKKDYLQAEQAFRDVIQRFKRTLPADNLNIGIARIKLGHCLLAEKRFRDSEPELRMGYEILAKQADPSVSWLEKGRKDLLAVYTALKQPEKVSEFQVALRR